MAFDQDAHFLEVGQEPAHGPAGNFASCAALRLILAFSGNTFSGKFAFTT